MPMLGHLHLRSNERSVIESTYQRFIPGCTVMPLEKSETTDCHLDLHGWPDIIVGEIGSNSGFSLLSGAQNDTAFFLICESGCISSDICGAKISIWPGDMLLLSFSGNVRVSMFSHSRATVIASSRSKIRNYSKVAFPHHGSAIETLTVPNTNKWVSAIAMVAHLLTQVMREQALAPIRSRQQEAFVDALLHVISIGMIDDRVRSPDSGTLSRGEEHVLAAEAFMRQNCNLPMEIADVARHLGISVRALQAAFRSHLAQTPITRLQAIRLEGLRAALVNRPGEDWRTIVTAWGYTNLSRVTHQFRKTFGETPAALTARLAAKGRA